MQNYHRYVVSVFETALFFRDIFEEGGDGDTRVINLLKPVDVKAQEIRGYVLYDLYKSRNFSLTEVSFELIGWGFHDVKLDVDGLRRDLAVLCSAYERPMQIVRDKKDIVDRCFYRLARYLFRMAEERVNPHSRIFEWFVPLEYVPQGKGYESDEYPEHVVPCAYLKNAAINMYEQGRSIEEVVVFLRKSLAIVWISDRQAEKLDRGVSNGGLGLKDSMPKEWSIETGCIFERLHVAEIEFEPPVGFLCNHGL